MSPEGLVPNNQPRDPKAEWKARDHQARAGEHAARVRSNPNAAKWFEEKRRESEGDTAH